MFHIVFACAAIALFLVCLILMLAAPGLGTLVSAGDGTTAGSGGSVTATGLPFTSNVCAWFPSRA